jgi:hypothetical protein
MPDTGIDILDAATIDRLTGSDPARAYVKAIVSAGAAFYLDNANVETKAITVGGKILPVLIASGRQDGNGEICSIYAHYVEYTIAEVTRRRPRLPIALLRALMLPLATVLSRGRVDRAVFVNNWLLPTNPAPGLSPAELAKVTGVLTAAHPDAAIVFRSVNARTDGPFVTALRESGYRLIRSRRVYLLDTVRGDHSRHDNFLLDGRLLARTPYAVLSDDRALLPHTDRMAALYRDLYLDKYTRLNPQLNERFFSLTVGERFLSYRALEKDGRVDGFISHFVQDGVMTGAVVGYDQGLPRKLGLYRQLYAILIREAAAQQLVLHLSGGAARFKELRGAVPEQEYDAVYDRHLPPSRRFAWACLAHATSLWSRL